MSIERLRALEKAVERVSKATPGPWLYRAKSNTFHVPPPEGTNYSFGYSIMAEDTDYPTFKEEDIDALLAAVNFIREHGSSLIAELGQEVGAVALIEAARDWIAKAPHGDNCYLDPDHAYGNSCYCGKESILSVLESPAHTSEARERTDDAYLGGRQEVTVYYVAEVLGGDFDNVPISMFGDPAIFSNRESAEKFCDFASMTGRKHEVRDIALNAAMRQEGGK